MNRRNWLQLSALALAGSGQAQTAATTVNAGSFLVTVPDGWAETAIIEKMPLLHLYSEQGWKAYEANPMYIMKPGYACRPQHWALRFPAAQLAGKPFDAKTAGHDPTAPQILIHKAAEWGLAYTDGIHENKWSAELVRSLRPRLDRWRTKDVFSDSPAAIEGGMSFRCLKKTLSFTGGYGIRVVGQRDIEANTLRRGRVHYFYLGMSSDNSCQIIATFPLDLPALPGESDDAEHLGRSQKRYGELSRGFEKYESEAKKWLESNANHFTPSLDTLDDIMQSLVVRKWQ